MQPLSTVAFPYQIHHRCCSDSPLPLLRPAVAARNKGRKRKRRRKTANDQHRNSSSGWATVTATFWEGSGLGTLETHSGQTRTRRRNFKEQKTGDHILCLEADQSSSSAGNGVEETICTGTAMVQQNIYDSSRTDISDPLVGYFLTVNKYSLPIFGLVKLVASHGYLKRSPHPLQSSPPKTYAAAIGIRHHHHGACHQRRNHSPHTYCRRCPC